MSKTLNNNRVSDSEFNLLLQELEKFHKLKAAIRAVCKNKNNNINNNAQPPPPAPDVEKIKTQLRKEIKQKLQKNAFGSERRIELKFERLNLGLFALFNKRASTRSRKLAPIEYL